MGQKLKILSVLFFACFTKTVLFAQDKEFNFIIEKQANEKTQRVVKRFSIKQKQEALQDLLDTGSKAFVMDKHDVTLSSLNAWVRLYSAGRLRFELDTSKAPIEILKFHPKKHESSYKRVVLEELIKQMPKKMISKIYGVSVSSIENWKNQYTKGELPFKLENDEILFKRKRETYSKEFKRDMVLKFHETGNKQMISETYGINMNTLSEWCCLERKSHYRELKTAVLYEALFEQDFSKIAGKFNISVGSVYDIINEYLQTSFIE